ncbi:surface protease GP63 [Trypanosoma cruzi]|uniref:Leishmanolysin-like peptidase n=1 Tax=Trypanosoma cruzi (strain CL Brener) TaxID=353153 RepID=Q4D3Q5_TRYCC|nr:surface protease GP63, putative [Trypanosoma cruzi]EAN87162.1 surface protease GP63, putative [Trypanosoma cruzi]RNC56413.1 surface protease GP63 [Trypanosoma cruzi]|eukprot:XP_809013.1 surface protease GP63 [Trypanosoma cruzi strain CL Brener]
MNSSNGNRHCEDDVVSSENGIILENEVVPAAVHPHADRMLVQPLEGPLIAPPFATGSACSRFTVRAGHCSTGVANADMVLCVAAALSVVVHSTTAAMAARKHQDCDDIDGMELQDGDGDGRTLESHWPQHHTKDEWMASIGCAVYCTEVTLAATADLGCMRVKWEMAEPMRWWRNSNCALLRWKCSALNMSEYFRIFCEASIPARRCTSDRYSSGWCVDGVSMKGQQNARWKVAPSVVPHWMWGCCRCYLEGRIFVCDAWGQARFVVSGHASHQHDGCEGPGRHIHLSAAMHAALRCLGMQVHLRVTEKGNVRCVPCTV